MNITQPSPPGQPSQLGDLADVLTGALATWATRDDSKAQPDVRESANAAIGAIDAMLADLHAARSALVAEIRVSDDATTARVDAMLAIPLEDRLAAREAGIRASLATGGAA
jgi:hypothetical protein